MQTRTVFGYDFNPVDRNNPFCPSTIAVSSSSITKRFAPFRAGRFHFFAVVTLILVFCGAVWRSEAQNTVYDNLLTPVTAGYSLPNTDNPVFGDTLTLSQAGQLTIFGFTIFNSSSGGNTGSIMTGTMQVRFYDNTIPYSSGPITGALLGAVNLSIDFTPGGLPSSYYWSGTVDLTDDNIFLPENILVTQRFTQTSGTSTRNGIVLFSDSYYGSSPSTVYLKSSGLAENLYIITGSSGQIGYQIDVLPPPTMVTNTNDDGPGSLRQALVDVVYNPAATVAFASNVVGTITLTNAGLYVGAQMTIAGPGANVLTVNGNNVGSVFHVGASGVTIAGLTISGGLSPFAGGGIYNQGQVTVSNCTITANASGASGGGLNNEGTLTIIGSTVCSNSAVNMGGGIYSLGDMFLTNSTICNNSGTGGGIYNDLTTFTAQSCTIASNSGGGVFSSTATPFQLGNTIAAANDSYDVNGLFASVGFNLIGDTNGSSGGPWLNSDLTGSTATPRKPLLGPLQNNGGTTPTMALLAGSPAIDKGFSFGTAIDQRKRTRPFDFSVITNASGGDGSDIGAFEYIPGATQLKLQLAGTNALLSWSTNDFGFQLQSLAALPSPPNIWSNVPGTPVIIGNRFFVTNAPVNGTKHFRLKAP